MASMTDRYRVGLDIGGTFTDFVLVDADTGDMRIHKCLTTPEDPAIGALEGLQRLLSASDLTLADVGHLVHGTTLVANAIIERRGAKLALLTTRGFRDALEMGRQQRYDIHDLFLQFPEPLAPRGLRREIDERISRDGDAIVPVDENQVRREAGKLAAAGVEAIAVCFLHAYKNPAHERAARDVIAAAHPEIAVSISSEVQPELREYDRVSTTTANAYVQPLMERYVRHLVDAFAERGFRGRFHLTQSSGGLVAPEVAIRFPIRLLESGPAGGALASAHFGNRVGKADVISFDMGGTTAKACLIQDGKVDIAPKIEAGRVHRFKAGSGLPIKAPVVDMIEVGAGGGSVARVDQLGLLKVGPGSAGADPGPACYGLGGTEPTVTDANLLLGYFDADFFLGGRMTLDAAAADKAVASVAKPLSLSTIAAAWGIYEIVCENMAAAARGHIVEKGRDPRRYAMVGMGGAGPAHVGRVARILGVDEVIIPPASGAASALGFLIAPISFERLRSQPELLGELDYGAVNGLLAELEAEGRDLIAEAGVAPADVTATRTADMRLFGQMHEITVRLPNEPLDENSLAAIKIAFAAEYTRRYTHLYEGAQIQAMHWRVLCSGPVPALAATRDAGHAGGGTEQKGTRQAYFPEAGGFTETPVYDRYALAPGKRIEGPAIIEEWEASTVVSPGDSVTVDEHGNLRLKIERHTRIETVVPAGMPLAEAVARIENDPIGLEIMWRRLINVAEESWDTVIRTAFSLIIGEAQDFACEVLDATGKQLAHSNRAMPVFNLTLPIAVNAMIEKYPAETLKPGDVLITNDPWLCAGHLFDIAIATPVFRKGRVVALMGTVGHVTDIGGTKDSLNARELYDEGFQIPPMKMFREGRINEDLMTLLAENVRGSEQVLGDLHALVSANASGAERIVEFMDEYGMEDLEALTTVVQDRAEKAMRDAIRELPDGVYENVVWGSGMGTPERYPIKITIRGDEIEVDYEGVPPQAEKGAANCTLGYIRGHTTYPLKCMLTPDVPGNAGCHRPIAIKAPEGSLFNAKKPAAVNLRTRTGWFNSANIFMALADAAPDQVQAFTGLPTSQLFYGRDAEGQFYDDHLFQGGGQGASSNQDGKSGLLWPTSASDTSIELFETRAPILVLTRQYIPDSGGPGRYRGGLGQLIQCRKLHDDGMAADARLYPIGVGIDTPGLFKGQPGGPTRARVLDSKGAELSDLGPGGLVSLSTTEHVAEMRLGGGSGYGDPLERPYAEVQRDLDGEYVMPQGAERDYGCVVDEDGRIDAAASDKLRKQRRKVLEPAQ